MCNLQANQKLVISYSGSNGLPIIDTLTNGFYSVAVNYTSGNQPSMTETFNAYVLTGNTTHSTTALSLKTISNGVTNNNFSTDCCLAYIFYNF